MTVQGHRAERIAEEIRNEVSLMLAGELKDPRLALPLIVTEVRVGPGMRTVRVFVQLPTIATLFPGGTVKLTSSRIPRSGS